MKDESCKYYSIPPFLEKVREILYFDQLIATRIALSSGLCFIFQKKIFFCLAFFYVSLLLVLLLLLMLLLLLLYCNCCCCCCCGFCCWSYCHCWCCCCWSMLYTICRVPGFEPEILRLQKGVPSAPKCSMRLTLWVIWDQGKMVAKPGLVRQAD